MWGLVLIAGFVLGCLLTAVVVLRRARRIHIRLRDELSNRIIVWGAQVRWRKPNGRWGAGGTLVVSADSRLSWTPLAAADGRLLPGCTWESRQLELNQLSSRRDITGLRFAECELVVDGFAYGRFGVFRPVGRLPVSITGRRPNDSVSA